MPRESLLGVPIDSGTPTASPAAATNFPVANLLTDWPDEPWQSTSTASQAISIDLGNTTTVVKLIALLFTNFSNASTWQIQASDVSNFASTRYDSGAIPFPAGGASAVIDDAWTDGIHEPPAFTVTQPRYWRLTLTDSTPAAGYFSAGRLVLCNPISGGPSAEGADDVPDDLALITGLLNGSERTGATQLVKLFENVEMLIDEDDKRSVVDAIARRGRSRPVLYVKDPEADAWRQRDIGYGRFLARPTVPLMAFQRYRFRFSIRCWNP